MSVIPLLASSLGQRGEQANIALAEKIAAANDKGAICELMDGLSAKAAVASDCIKTLYETGERNPGLIAPYASEFVKLLEHKNNRLAWGAMTALHYITPKKPDEVYSHLPAILKAADSGSVITRDHAVGILCKLAAVAIYRPHALQLVAEQLSRSPVNQLPMYAEMVLPVATAEHNKLLIQVLSIRLPDVDKESKRKRITKVLAQLEKLK